MMPKLMSSYPWNGGNWGTALKFYMRKTYLLLKGSPPPKKKKRKERKYAIPIRCLHFFYFQWLCEQAKIRVQTKNNSNIALLIKVKNIIWSLNFKRLFNDITFDVPYVVFLNCPRVSLRVEDDNGWIRVLLKI